MSVRTDIHGAGAADALPAGAPERQRGVHFVLDLDQRVQNHRPTVIQVNLIKLLIVFSTAVLRSRS